jgi:hypothetical protein
MKSKVFNPEVRMIPDDGVERLGGELRLELPGIHTVLKRALWVTTESGTNLRAPCQNRTPWVGAIEGSRA